MIVRWHGITVYGGYIVALSPILWAATWQFWQHVAPPPGSSPTLFGVIYVLLAALLTIASVVVPAFGMVGWSERCGKLPIPVPRRVGKREALERRLGECREIKAEVETALSRIHSPESAFAVTLQARLNELEGVEETIKTEMAGDALVDLDQRATKVVRKELKS